MYEMQSDRENASKTSDVDSRTSTTSASMRLTWQLSRALRMSGRRSSLKYGGKAEGVGEPQRKREAVIDWDSLWERVVEVKRSFNVRKALPSTVTCPKGGSKTGRLRDAHKPAVNAAFTRAALTK